MDKEKTHAEYLLEMAEGLQAVWNDHGGTINGLEIARAYALVLGELRHCEYAWNGDMTAEVLEHPVDGFELTREHKKTPNPNPPETEGA